MTLPAPLPQGACDTHFHVYGGPTRHPLHQATPFYEPPRAPTEDLLAVHKALGIERGVIVHPHAYGADFSLMLDFLERAPAGAYRGCAIVNDTIDDTVLEELHAAGVRAARFHFQERFGATLGMAEFHRSVARISELGWVTKIFARGPDYAAIGEGLRHIKSPISIDHLGRLDVDEGLPQAPYREILRLLERGNWWISLSNGDVRDQGPTEPWSDAAPFGRGYFEAAPERCVWGTDWPHISYRRRGLPLPDDAALVRLVLSYLPDQDAVRAVLTDNPAVLYGFS